MRWRQMTEADMQQVIDLAAVIHLDHPEDDDVIIERRTFFPEACLVLEGDGGLHGYTLVHPVEFEKPPALNALIGKAPVQTDIVHIHDIALAPEARGTGASGKAIEIIVEKATDAGFKQISIVAVNGTEPFWEKQGFRHHTSEKLAKKLASYDGTASYMLRPLV
ncbi:GNAT family N-acetyltransferase [Kordiimonas gwangyangensis]|uniref:GNAT family N-acetyltransferase n=1 Tax=Kordiimonas gwangyangensis TaxID=288022 RepID=UPI000374E7BF|nr:GNAT family N-acetyltransferase [Kordiimonas gwangyangensis]